MGFKATLGLGDVSIPVSELRVFVELADRLGAREAICEYDDVDERALIGLSIEAESVDALAPMRPEGPDVTGWITAIDAILSEQGDARGALYELRSLRDHLQTTY
jgi:hypothetical protein